MQITDCYTYPVKGMTAVVHHTHFDTQCPRWRWSRESRSGDRGRPGVHL